MQSNSNPDITTHTSRKHIREDVRALIDRAAKAQSKSYSDFIIDAARRAAEDTLLDQTFLQVDEETYRYFLSVLLAKRDTTLWDYQILVESAQNILGVLSGLNRLYYSTF